MPAIPSDQMIWHVPGNMQSCANQTVMQFGTDQRGTVAYKFDHLGFRNDDVSTHRASVIVVGNSISFGLGIEFYKTFGSLTAKKLDRPLINIAFGCYRHDNLDHLGNIENLLRRDCDDIWLVQINNLDRCRVQDGVISDAASAPHRLQQYWQQIENLLGNHQRRYLYWDHVDHDLPSNITSRWLIRNQLHLDRSIAGEVDTFGERSHYAIHRVIVDSLVRSW